MKYLFLFLTVVFLAGNIAAEGKEPISSALGKKLGGTFEVEEGAKTHRESDGSDLYAFTPTQKPKPFDQFFLEVTAKTKKISQIWAVKAFKDFPEARDARDSVLEALEKKYGPRAGEGDRYASLAAMQRGFVIKSGTRMIMVVIMEEEGKYRLILKYIDRVLKVKAKDERIELEREKSAGGDMGGAI